MGGGIACVAFVTWISYTNAKHRLFERDMAGKEGYLCMDMVRALGGSGRKYGYRHVKRPMHFSTNIIVFIKDRNVILQGIIYAGVGRDGWNR